MDRPKVPNREMRHWLYLLLDTAKDRAVTIAESFCGVDWVIEPSGHFEGYVTHYRPEYNAEKMHVTFTRPETVKEYEGILPPKQITMWDAIDFTCEPEYKTLLGLWRKMRVGESAQVASVNGITWMVNRDYSYIGWAHDDSAVYVGVLRPREQRERLRGKPEQEPKDLRVAEWQAQSRLDTLESI